MLITIFYELYQSINNDKNINEKYIQDMKSFSMILLICMCQPCKNISGNIISNVVTLMYDQTASKMSSQIIQRIFTD